MGEEEKTASAARALANQLLRRECEAGLSIRVGGCVYHQWLSAEVDDELELLEAVNPDFCCRNCRRWVLAETLAQDLESGALIERLPPSVRERLVQDAKTELQRGPRDNHG